MRSADKKFALAAVPLNGVTQRDVARVFLVGELDAWRHDRACSGEAQLVDEPFCLSGICIVFDPVVEQGDHPIQDSGLFGVLWCRAKPPSHGDLVLGCYCLLVPN